MLNERFVESGGYSTSLIAIRDPAVVATSGKTHHKIAEHSTNPGDEVPGTVFDITAEELAAAGDGDSRSLPLSSGRKSSPDQLRPVRTLMA